MRNKQIDIYIILVSLIAVCVIMGVILLKEEPVNSIGTQHPTIENIQIGGDGAARIKGNELSGFLIYSITFIILISLVILGISKRYRNRKFWLWIILIAIAIQFIWFMLFRSYLDWLHTGDLNMFLGFPGPTAWMIYGLWGGGALLTLLYVIGFRKYIYTKEDEEALQKIAKDYSEGREEV